MLPLSFIHKNTLRKYPLRASASWTSTDGMVLPVALIAGCRLTTPADKVEVFISRVCVQGQSVGITISTTTEVLGCFQGVAVQDYTTLAFTPTQNTVGGTLTLGTLEAIEQAQGNHHLTFEAGQLEASTVLPIVPPAVNSIQYQSQEVRGNVRLVLDNLQVNTASESYEDNQLTFEVTNKKFVESVNDRAAKFLTCGFNLIKGINTVLPDDNGNIDIYGIHPVVVAVDNVSNSIRISLDELNVEDLCASSIIVPPLLGPGLDPDRYIPPLIGRTEPEWKTWPQYAGMSTTVTTQ